MWLSGMLTAVSLGACVPAFFLVMPETRTSIILRRRAAKLRKERGLSDGGRYLCHAEVEKVKFMTAMKNSLIRPLVFLATEPIVMFFSLWVALAVRLQAHLVGRRWLTASGVSCMSRWPGCRT